MDSSSTQKLGQLSGHAAARINTGRHVLDTGDHTALTGMLGQLPEPTRQECLTRRARVAFVREG